MVRSRQKDVQALTLRIPVDEYNLLRTQAFVSDMSINEVVLLCLQIAIGPEQRRGLTQILEQAKEARRRRGRPADLPRNPQGRGPKSKLSSK
jgi:hypothetical protein